MWTEDENHSMDGFSKEDTGPSTIFLSAMGMIYFSIFFQDQGISISLILIGSKNDDFFQSSYERPDPRTVILVFNSYPPGSSKW